MKGQKPDNQPFTISAPMIIAPASTCGQDLVYSSANLIQPHRTSKVSTGEDICPCKSQDTPWVERQSGFDAHGANRTYALLTRPYQHWRWEAPFPIVAVHGP